MRSAWTCLVLLAFLGAAAADEPPQDGRRLVATASVTKPGFHEIPAAALKRLGLEPGRFEILRGGERVQVGAGGRFLIERPQSEHVSRATVEVWATPRRRAAADATEIALTEPTARRDLDADRVWGNVASGRPEVYAADVPTWYLARMERGQGITILLDALHAEPGTPQTLELEVVGTHVGEIVIDAVWGGASLGVQTTRLDPATGRWPPLVYEVPADAVPDGEAELVVRDLTKQLPGAPPNDVTRGRGRVFFDRVSLRGRVSPTVGAGLHVFDAADVTADGLAPLRIAGQRDAVATKLGDRIVASTTVHAAEPVAVERRPNPLARAGDAVHVIIATPPLLEAAARLAAHRSKTGTPSAVVPVVGIYQRYGHGEATPAAIRRFVEALEAKGHVRYVLLAGDATLDRTDLTADVTIPAPMARTMYNGATASDRLYVRPADGAQLGGPSIGRLPYRDGAALDAYVDRVIRYETKPPADASRRLLRFVTSEGRFGALADQIIENIFKRVIADSVPAVYDVELTNASATSPFLWPPRELGDKVVSGINEGSLFYVYMGHGFEEGFDTLRVGADRFRILHLDDVPRVAVEGTPPAMFVIACTTAIFDLPLRVGVGEALLSRPKGPIAYWGATRVCHPAANSLVGIELAQRMARGEGRLGDILDDAWDAAIEPPETDGPTMRHTILLGLRVTAGDLDIDRLLIEGRWMYALLGDPAIRIAFPKQDIELGAIGLGPQAEIQVRAPLPDGTAVTLSLETRRDRRIHRPTPVENVLDPRAATTIKENHALMNDWTYATVTVVLQGGEGKAHLTLPEGEHTLYLKAHAVAKGEVHHGVTQLR